MAEDDRRRAAVIGAGLVGCFTACMLTKQGYKVDIYEVRSDPRSPTVNASRSRSINLAVSARGIEAIRAVDEALADRLMSEVIPMKGRMIHDLRGRQTIQLYGLQGECINSIDRNILNNTLISEAAALPNVSFYWQHKLIRADFDQGILTFEVDSDPQNQRQARADLTIGADGAWSKVRTEMMRSARMYFEQDYIDHAYLELSIPPGRDPSTGESKYLLDPNHLHIWPRQSFMLIALPNQDKSFTCTLFAPFANFDALPPPQTPSEKTKIFDFFSANFPDALELIGRSELLQCFREHPRGSLVMIKCTPYTYKDRAIILGDAAHSMVPFYGQGMNCGLEDVRVLQCLIVKHRIAAQGQPSHLSNALRAAFDEYSATRHADLQAICSLAKRNYIEMRSSVTSWAYMMRKSLDRWLANTPGLKGRWIPLYTMVTFRSDLTYSDAIRREARQAKIVDLALDAAVAGLMTAILVGLRIWRNNSRMRLF